MLARWDLVGFGPEFDHERLEQRIERAEFGFTDRLEPDLRARLKAALPQLGLKHWNVDGLLGFVEPELFEELQGSPVDRRQKKPMSTTIVGREQTALMEAIDRGQLDLARELMHKGADLNFINSVGDTCVTKAFARKDYDLVLDILRRNEDGKPRGIGGIVHAQYAVGLAWHDVLLCWNLLGHAPQLCRHAGGLPASIWIGKTDHGPATLNGWGPSGC